MEIVKCKGKNAESRNREMPATSNTHDLMTLQGVLELFGLPEQLTKLDDSIDMVRKHTKSKGEHEQYMKEVDKTMQKLSLKYHPDKIKSRGASDEELAQSHMMQTLLNATRLLLKILNESFLQDLDIDYKYQFYAKMDISLLGNEDEIKTQNLGVLHKVAMLSEIKQEKIIANINKFLKASMCSIDSFIKCDIDDFIKYNVDHSIKSNVDYSIKSNIDDFEKNRLDALLRLSMCMEGYKRLVVELNEVEKECKEDETLKSMCSLIYKMAHDSSKQLNTLKKLEELAEDSLKGRFRIFTPYESLDEYFVLPFVKYINLLLMCSNMFSNIKEKKNETRLSKLKKVIHSSLIKQEKIPKQEPDFNREDLYCNAYYLVSYFNDNSKYENEVTNIIGKTGGEITSIEVIYKFIEIAIEIKTDLEVEFKPDAYVEGGTKNYIMNEYIKWKKIVDDVLKDHEEFLADTKTYVENSKIENRKLTKVCDRVLEDNTRLGEVCDKVIEHNMRLGEACDKVVEDNMRLGEKYDRAVEENRKMREEMRKFRQMMCRKPEMPIQNKANNKKASVSQQQRTNDQTNQQKELGTLAAANDQPEKCS